MDSRKRIQVKVMENLTDEEMISLIEGLKKMEGFDFSISSFIILTHVDEKKM
jgi:hypothetical protein